MHRPLASLKTQSEFKHVYKNGKSAAMPLFVVYAAKNDLSLCRLGVSVSKKVGNAVKRNRVRRLVRENCRLMFAAKENPRGFDIIVIARTPSAVLPRAGSFVAVGATLSKLFTRLGVRP